MEFLHILSGFSSPVLKIIAFFFTLFGSYFMFILCCAILFWSFSKKVARQVLLTYAMSGLLAFLLNAAIHIPYPFLSDSGIHTISFLREILTGYSFPSTGIFTIACLCAGIFLNNVFTRVKLCAVAFYVIAAFSYLYLGLCTPWSLALATGISIAAAIGAKIVVKEFNFDFAHYRFFITITAIPLFVHLCVILSLFFNDVISTQSMTTYLGFMGAYVGILVSVFLEVGFVKMNYHCDHSYQQVIKCLIGGAITVTLMAGSVIGFSFIPNFIFTDMITCLITSVGAFYIYPIFIQKYFAAKYN